MTTEITVEWVDGDKAKALFESRRAKAASKGEQVSPDDSWWDWVEIEECVVSRPFASVEAAKVWAGSNPAVDLYESPRVYRNDWPGREKWNAETTLQLEYQGNGQWLDMDTGQLLQPTEENDK